MRGYRVLGPIRRKFPSFISSQTICQPELFNKYFVSFFGNNILSVGQWGKLFRLDTILKANLHPTGYKMGEDLIFAMQVFLFCNTYTIIDYHGYNYRVGGLTSRHNPTLWNDLKSQYFFKRSVAVKYNYTKALRPLNIELQNVFLSEIYQRLQYLNESRTGTLNWIVSQLEQTELWNDINSSSIVYDNEISQMIRDKNSEAILCIVEQRLKKTRWQRLAKRILSFFL